MNKTDSVDSLASAEDEYVPKAWRDASKDISITSIGSMSRLKTKSIANATNYSFYIRKSEYTEDS